MPPFAAAPVPAVAAAPVPACAALVAGALATCVSGFDFVGVFETMSGFGCFSVPFGSVGFGGLALRRGLVDRLRLGFDRRRRRLGLLRLGLWLRLRARRTGRTGACARPPRNGDDLDARDDAGRRVQCRQGQKRPQHRRVPQTRHQVRAAGCHFSNQSSLPVSVIRPTS
jgi:hypothetical protein